MLEVWLVRSCGGFNSPPLPVWGRTTKLSLKFLIKSNCHGMLEAIAVSHLGTQYIQYVYAFIMVSIAGEDNSRAKPES